MPRLHLTHVARIQVVSPVAVYMYPVSATKCYGDMYPLVSGYKLLVRDNSIRLHVSGVNAALGHTVTFSDSEMFRVFQGHSGAFQILTYDIVPVLP